MSESSARKNSECPRSHLSSSTHDDPFHRLCCSLTQATRKHQSIDSDRHNGPGLALNESQTRSSVMSGYDGGNLAILIDADNVSSKVIAGLMAEVANYGRASVRRIYGDWTSPNMKSWRDCLLEHSLTPIQQFAYTTGKNATDGAMIIDAMDLLYTGRFSSFCLVSSDSDFTRLASRIREQGIIVYGECKDEATNLLKD